MSYSSPRSLPCASPLPFPIEIPIIGGSFFDGVEPGADCYVLKSILHDWDDDQCLAILRNVAAESSPQPLKEAA